MEFAIAAVIYSLNHRNYIMLSHYHPALYALAVCYHRYKREISQLFDPYNYVSIDAKGSRLEFNVKRHSSRLLKKLGNSEMWLQHNKVDNLRICVDILNNLVIKPGETFSFCKLIGKPTKQRGFKEGMELTMGKARPGIGGGICQLANLLHWLILHSPLTVLERSTHSFDPFPDEKRSIPFGTGCAIFYNYVDFKFTNKTTYAFHLNLSIDEKNLNGHLTSDRMIEHSYKVFEKNHSFTRKNGSIYRENEIWRKVSTRLIGELITEEHIKSNSVRVLYQPAPELIVDKN